ncbi:hypothetical protein CU669_00135 [Paramagnetospirillum kuznetsovii]|uniref:Aminoglycoside N(3)-acetyltransferase n=1 Tax=Paramagnetospirillum kuznetsovii TaxID=2053833 RepID=A0A364P2J7_9PROT|nr:AAC(3) family N-acetyltransferase [Paramagnetospirillum kuznetsovii]RAU23553.1 hypothetical protein CU669_00135 [Paramagnetospirillum kuznetsovii]
MSESGRGQPYTYDELVAAYAELGVERGRLVYLTSDIGKLFTFETPGKTAVLEAHYRALLDLIGPEGTLVIPTANLNLCNTDILFDPANTPSHNVGMLSEFIRRQPGVRRSMHPFESYAAVGSLAADIIDDASRHAFGPESPEGRMAERDALSVSIGLYPRFSCSTMHHVEHLMAVPYRYTKEYMHPVLRDGVRQVEPFYRMVRYADSDIERSFGQYVFEDFTACHTIRKADVGRGSIYAYSMGEFVKSAVSSFKRDPYIWCVRPPELRPWRV